MITIYLKPLSVNSAYMGRRFSTDAHKEFKASMNILLPIKFKMPEPPYVIYFKFGVSSSLSDGDNLVKAAQDCIADKYKFNDRLIKKWVIDVEKVNKGKEYIKFNIENLK